MVGSLAFWLPLYIVLTLLWIGTSGYRSSSGVIFLEQIPHTFFLQSCGFRCSFRVGFYLYL